MVNEVTHLSPDLQETRRFLQAMGLSETEKLTFQVFDDSEKKDPRLARILHGTLDELADELTVLNRQRRGVFWTVNQTNLKGRKAENVIRVRSLFVDLDGAPVESVQNCSLPPNLIVESSPGRYHAYWKVSDCPLEKFGSVQKALASKFNGDPAIHDLPRVMRLPGFIHQKNNPFMTRLVQVNEKGAYSLAEIMSGLQLTIEAETDNGTNFQTNQELVIPKGQRNRTLVTVAARLRNAGMTGQRLYEALLKENEARCKPPLTNTEVKKIAEWGAKKQPGEVPPARSTEQRQYQNIKSPGRIMSWRELDETDFLEPQYVVNELLPQGLTIFAGRPKVGKSWLVQHLSLAIATDELALGKFPVNRGPILHLALEDTPTRFKYRMNKLNGHGPAPQDAYFVDQWPRLPDAANHLEGWIAHHPDCRLVVVDSLAKIRPRNSSRYEGVYDKDYSDIGELQHLAGKYALAIILVHHERKAESQDDYDRVSGSVKITGAADTVWILERKDRSRMQGVLIISGRDISDRKYALTWNEGLWSYEGTPAELDGNKARQEIIGAMSQIGRPCSQSEIGQQCRKTRQAVQKHLPKLLEDGIIEPSAGQTGKYRLAPGVGEYPATWDEV